MITGEPIPVVDVDVRAQVMARYKWEVEAMARDIRDKLEMGILTLERVPGYLSDLLRAHPRLTDLDRAAETVWASTQRPQAGQNLTPDRLTPLEQADSPVKMLAYFCMGWDVVCLLRDTCGLRWT